jgi:hypothetical protein
VTAGRVWVTAGKVWLMPEKARRLKRGPFFVFSSYFQITIFLKIDGEPLENLGDR